MGSVGSSRVVMPALRDQGFAHRQRPSPSEDRYRGLVLPSKYSWGPEMWHIRYQKTVGQHRKSRSNFLHAILERRKQEAVELLCP